MSGRRLHGDMEGPPTTVAEAVFDLVRAIPRGRVMTYGQIAGELGSRVSPRAVGWILHRCPDDVPWHRVVNAQGACSTDRLPDFPKGLQRALLEAEEIAFGPNACLDLDRYRWWPGEVGGGV